TLLLCRYLKQREIRSPWQASALSTDASPRREGMCRLCSPLEIGASWVWSSDKGGDAMTNGCFQRLILSGALLLLPFTALAQNLATGTITGVARDASGAVLPGVTVEAASPALIEKVRTVQ